MVVKNEDFVTKKVAILCRVSTKGQLKDDDIPTQRNSCLAFIAKQPGWEMVKEYQELGVSGFKKSVADRDIIQLAKKDAENGEFDVLLVFMFDRLGRRDDETPFVLEWFVKQGVEMWSVQEGQQKLEGHTDKLINYLRFWQAHGESRKTSERVDESHRQAVLEGKYRGGSVPFGYKTERSGVINNKGHELLQVVIDEENAGIVNWMYDMVVEEGYGQYRLARLLNEKGFKTTKGNNWSASGVNVVLSNPMYKGFMRYGKGTDREIYSKEAIKDLIIVSEEVWERAQQIREARNPVNSKKEENQYVINTTKGELLLVGMIRCGYCGHPLTTTYNRKSYDLVDGTEHQWSSAKYRCSGKAQHKANCTGQTIYSPNRIERVVLDEVYAYLDRLESYDLANEIKDLKKGNIAQEMAALRAAQTELSKVNKQLEKFKEEVIKVLMGESEFTSDVLNPLILQTEERIVVLQTKVVKAEAELKTKEIRQKEVESLQKHIPVWRNVFKNASTPKKKMMLSTIIERVIVFRDTIKLSFKLDIGSFLSTAGVTYNGAELFEDVAKPVSKVLTHEVNLKKIK